jgi:TetR/AcrR family transcriptional repressor of nem operon
MKEAGLTHGGFYRHFDSREHLVAEAAQRALSQGSTWTIAAAQLGGQRGYAARCGNPPLRPFQRR